MTASLPRIAVGRDAPLLAFAALHAVLVVLWPVAPVIALGVWWNSNTVAHNFIHCPFFRSRGANRMFSFGLSLLLGVPQTLWRDRHLAHHVGREWRLRVSRQLVIETAGVLLLWAGLAMLNPSFFLAVYLRGYGVGLLLCAMQGHYEHHRGVVSHYGRAYNLLFFNDGYHAEHHTRPGMHWTELPSLTESAAGTSAWPAVLRWLDAFSLEGLERLALRSTWLRWFVLAAHRRAFQELRLDVVERVVIVGGGLFPRTALLLRELLPGARIEIVDASLANLEVARAFLGDSVVYTHRHYSGERCDADLLVIPLAYHGDRDAVYHRPPARAVVVHDWLWRRRGSSRAVPLLMKRLNLVRS